MDISFSKKLAVDRDELFDDLEKLIIRKKRLDLVANMLIGLVEENLIFYYLSDIPYSRELFRDRKELKKKALYFISNNFKNILTLINDKNLDKKVAYDLIYLLAIYLKIYNEVEAKNFLELAFVSLDRYFLTNDSKMVVNLLCRFDLECLGVKAGIFDECQKEPFNKVIEVLEKSNYQLYYELSTINRFKNKEEVDLNRLKQEANDILDNLSLYNREQIYTLIESCLERKKINLDNNLQSQTITQTQNIIYSDFDKIDKN